MAVSRMGVARRRPDLIEKARGVGDEFLAAAGGAEIVCRAGVPGLVLGRRRIDRHAADGILGE
jgi:hypothetical protein